MLFDFDHRTNTLWNLNEPLHTLLFIPPWQLLSVTIHAGLQRLDFSTMFESFLWTAKLISFSLFLFSPVCRIACHKKCEIKVRLQTVFCLKKKKIIPKTENKFKSHACISRFFLMVLCIVCVLFSTWAWAKKSQTIRICEFIRRKCNILVGVSYYSSNRGLSFCLIFFLILGKLPLQVFYWFSKLRIATITNDV